MAIAVILALLVLLLLGVPVAIGIAASTMLGAFVADIPFSRLPQTMLSSLTSFPMLAIPLFVLTGKIMERAGLSLRLVAFARSLVGHLRGGMGYVSILALTFFGAISGSTIAAIVAIGSILIPAMVQQGYDRGFASATQAAGGLISGIIPPSIPLILYGVVAGVSVGDLFLAGVVPGMMFAVTLMLVIFLWTRSERGSGFVPDERASVGTVARHLRGALLSLLLPVIILGGIYGGIFTPTEAAAVAVIYGLVLGLLVYRTLSVRALGEVLVSTARISAVLLFIIATASYFSSWLTRERVPYDLANWLQDLQLPSVVTLLAIFVFMLTLGMFMEAAAAMIISTPILLPVAVAIGMDPIHFGIFIVAALSIGLLTPPIGVGLFVASHTGKLPVARVVRPALYMAGALMVTTLLILFIPELSLYLVELSR